MRDDIRRRPARRAVPAAHPSPAVRPSEVPRTSAADHPASPVRTNLLEPVTEVVPTPPRANDRPVTPQVVAPPVAEVPAPPAAPPALNDPTHHRRLRQATLTAVTVVSLLGIGLRAQADSGFTKQATVDDAAAATAALQTAKDRLTAGDFAGAEREFAAAEGSLHQANLRLSKRGLLGGPLPPVASGQIAAGRDLVSGGEELARSGRQLSGELTRLTATVSTSGDPYQAGVVLADRADEIRRELRQAGERLDRFATAARLARVSGGFAEQAEQFDRLEAGLPRIQDSLKQADSLAEALPVFLGADRFKQYLVLFQNPAELRATGGFIGTYGLATLDNGRLKELKVDSIYNPANQANQLISEPAPPPYHRFAEAGTKPIYAMQNSNYSPDFPSTAKRFRANYELAGGPTTDGVIGLTVGPILEILRITGPIEMTEYGYTLTADNFQTLLQEDQQSRAELGETDPKKILRDFAPQLSARIARATPEQQKRIAEALVRAVDSRDLTATFTDGSLDQLADRIGLRGALPNVPGGLSVIDDNVAGFKSSIDISTSYRHRLTVAPDGTVTGELTVTRRHSGATSPALNQNFTRLFLPQGTRSQNISGNLDGSGTLERDEDGYTVIGAWTDVAPEEERTTVFTYVLPDRIDLRGGALPVGYFKQAGRRADYELSVTLPPGYRWGSGQASADGRTRTIADPAGDDYTDVLTFRED